MATAAARDRSAELERLRLFEEDRETLRAFVASRESDHYPKTRSVIIDILDAQQEVFGE